MEGQLDNLTGVKHDSGKPRMSLLPYRALVESAKVLMFGAAKYGDHNWRGGFVWTRVSDAAERHLGAWKDGEDLDPESGLPHIAHAICDLLFLMTFIQAGTGVDDRYKGQTK